MRILETLPILVVAALAGNCAINPATGKRQLMLISEAQEIELGRQNDEAVVAEMGVYEAPELASYVEQLGRGLAAISERSDLAWTFRVIDDPVVNAFALPGGYVYVTRGILAHLDNEAELAGVLGHEIGHVTARHSANQISKSQLTQVGLTAATVFGPRQMSALAELAGQGFGLLFLKFGRDDERQADDLGVRYMMKTGYDPRPMAEVFETLGRVSAASDSERIPGWLSTHPTPENRTERIEAQIAAGGIPPNPSSFGRGAYLEKLEGVVYGSDPREGFFRDELFLHPGLEFQIAFPVGWQMQNLKSAVAAMSPENDVVIALTLASEATAEAALGKFFSNQQISALAPAAGPIHGLPTAGNGFRAATENGVVTGRVVFVEHGSRVFRLMGYAAETIWPQHGPTVSAAIASFDKLRDRSALDVEPARVHIVRPTKAMTPEEFAKAFDASVPPETLALINQIDAGERFVAGEPYKVVRGGPDEK